MSAAEHTPTPWQVKGDGETVKIADMAGDSLASLMFTHLRGRRLAGEVKANAAFIVRACNEYDGLRERVKVLERALRRLVSDRHGHEVGCACPWCHARSLIYPSSPTHGQDSNV